jgi:hypothetical protein
MTIFLAREKISADKKNLRTFSRHGIKICNTNLLPSPAAFFLTDLMKKNLCHEKCLINQTASRYMLPRRSLMVFFEF